VSGVICGAAHSECALRATETLCRGIELGPGPRGDDDARSAAHEFLGYPVADATAAAGDEGNPPGEVLRRPVPFLRHCPSLFVLVIMTCRSRLPSAESG
jgi:hypothetical protein